MKHKFLKNLNIVFFFKVVNFVDQTRYSAFDHNFFARFLFFTNETIYLRLFSTFNTSQDNSFAISLVKKFFIFGCFILHNCDFQLSKTIIAMIVILTCKASRRKRKA